jgi:hypothetical protein
VARILIVGGGCRGRRLASALTAGPHGHAVRITTRSETGRTAIEQTGAECWIGTPDRLATLRGALENVTIVCWLLATAGGSPEELAALHGSRLEFFLGQAIDSTVRGFVYEAPLPTERAGEKHAAGAITGEGVPATVLAEGERIVRAMGARNTIPLAFLTAGPDDPEAWQLAARTALGKLLGESP